MHISCKINGKNAAFFLLFFFSWQPPVGTPTADSIVRKLTNAGLETYLYLSVQEDEIICKIR